MVLNKWNFPKQELIEEITGNIWFNRQKLQCNLALDLNEGFAFCLVGFSVYEGGGS